jgi:hypothetical protein
VGDQKSFFDTIAALQKELACEQQARKEANKDAETLTKAVEELKDMLDKLLAHVPPWSLKSRF